MQVRSPLLNASDTQIYLNKNWKLPSLDSLCFYCSVTSQLNFFTNDNNNSNNIDNKAFLFHTKWKFVLFSAVISFSKNATTPAMYKVLSLLIKLWARKGGRVRIFFVFPRSLTLRSYYQSLASCCVFSCQRWSRNALQTD